MLEQKYGIAGTMVPKHQVRHAEDWKQPTRVTLTRLVILFLLCALPILSTLAKDSLYLPQSNTAHYINIAAKMKVADAPVAISQPQIAEPLIVVTVTQPEIRITRQDELEGPSVPKVSLTVCLQHRSPPQIHS